MCCISLGLAGPISEGSGLLLDTYQAPEKVLVICSWAGASCPKEGIAGEATCRIQ